MHVVATPDGTDLEVLIDKVIGKPELQVPDVFSLHNYSNVVQRTWKIGEASWIMNSEHFLKGATYLAQK